MKMNDVKNKKVVSALMIGISAMMALQTPITAYASGDGIEPQPDSQPTTEHSSEASTSADAGSSVQQEVSSASDAADAAVESVVGEQPAPAPVVETTAEAEAPVFEAPAETPAPVAEAPAETPAPEEAPAEAETPTEAEGGSVAETPAQTEVAAQETITPAAENLNPEITPQPGTAAFETADASDKILDEQTGAKAGEVVTKDNDGNVTDLSQAVIDDATAIAEDSVDETGAVIDQAAVTDIEESAKELIGTQADLDVAEETNAQIEKIANDNKGDYKSVYDSASGIIDATDGTIILMDAAIDDATQKANEQIQKIENAETKEEAEAASIELENIITKADTTYAQKLEVLAELSDRYDAAVKKLTDAAKELDRLENILDTNLDDASVRTEKAKEKLQDARADVANLKSALDVVENKLVDDVDSAERSEDLRKKQTNKWKISTNYPNNRRLMADVVENYYLPEVLNVKNAVNFDWHGYEMQSAGDNQECRYMILTYETTDSNGDVIKDADGNPVTETKYFNWDFITKNSTENNRYKNLGSDQHDGIVIFEKSQSEIDASAKIDEYMAEYYATNNTNAQRQKMANQGRLDVYTYVDQNGETQYIFGDMFFVVQGQKKVNESAFGTVTRDEKGKITTFNGIEVTEVVQSKNNLLHDANCLAIASDDVLEKYLSGTNDDGKFIYDRLLKEYTGGDASKEDEAKAKINIVLQQARAVNAFRSGTVMATAEESNALLDKYKGYIAETNEALTTIADAQSKSVALADAIEVVKKKKDQRVVLAKDILGTEDVATYFGIELSDEDASALNTLTVSQLFGRLELLKSKAELAKAAAEKKLQTLKETDLQSIKDAIDAKYAASEEVTPVTPDEPDVPETPTDPDTPVEPDTPDVPVEPETPDTPEITPEPETPVTPEITPEPETPVTPEITPESETPATEITDAETPTADTAETVTPEAAIAATAINVPGGAPIAEFNTPGVTPADQNVATFATANIADQAVPAAPAADIPADIENTVAVENNETIEIAQTTGNVQATENAQAIAGDQVADIQTGGAETTAEIAEEDVALSATPEVIAEENIAPAEDPAFTILDEDSAKASTIEATETARKISWWWLLIIAVLGATGQEMYRKHLEKEESKNSENTPKDF
jgi:hypothetical protein